MTIINEVPNRLIEEKSPYLLQHAYNPVRWYPWGNEAFEKAKAENKPIFLSIGYSTCHWCHVMAHESFEDKEVAEALNRSFVCIKVDREERPDIDAVYMNAAHSMTGQGGWPLTIIMTPEQKPFFAGTYIPKKARYNMLGLIDILNIITDKWKFSRDDLISSSNRITEAIKRQGRERSEKAKLSKDLFIRAKKTFEKNFDEVYGGFGGSPKFPQPSNLLFLLKLSLIENDDKSLHMAEKTLDCMYRGGIFDHIGFGFARYSTDDRWLVPHFEKMLYDNAQLAFLYTEAFKVTGKELYRNVAEKVLEYVLREMTDEKGGFYSAQDADSEGEEGKYYVFRPEEITKVLGDEKGKIFNEHFNITEKGNFEGKNIPNLLKNKYYNLSDEKIEVLLEEVYEYRLRRTTLHKDDKILTSWNGMMTAALADAYGAFSNEKYLEAAENSINFFEKFLTDEDGNLGARYREGTVLWGGTLDDYAFYVYSLIEMYDVTFKSKYLKKAVSLTEKMIKLFWDYESGGFFMTGRDKESLIFNPKEVYDGVQPSGNSMASYDLIRLSKLTGNAEFENMSQKQFEFLSDKIADYPAPYSFALVSLMQELYPTTEIVCIAADGEDLLSITKILRNNLNFNLNIIAVFESDLASLSEAIDYIKYYKLVHGKTTYYICKNKECSLPYTDIDDAIKAVKSSSGI